MCQHLQEMKYILSNNTIDVLLISQSHCDDKSYKLQEAARKTALTADNAHQQYNTVREKYSEIK